MPRGETGAERGCAVGARSAEPTDVTKLDCRHANFTDRPPARACPNNRPPGAEKASPENAVFCPATCIQELLNPGTPLTSGMITSHVAGTPPRYADVSTTTTYLLFDEDPCRNTNRAAVG